MIIPKRMRSLLGNKFIRSASVLVGGTAFAQAIMVLVLPILTRLYSPEDFSTLAVYMSIVGITSVAACLRLEIAIPIPEHDSEGCVLLVLSIAFAFAISLLLSIPIIIAPEYITELINQPRLLPYLWLVPVGTFIAASYSATQFWIIRKKSFTIIAKTRVVQSCVAASTQIGLGLMGAAPLGLILGQVLNNGAGMVGLTRRIANDDRSIFKAVSRLSMQHVLRSYSRFPRYSALEALANSAGMQLPVVLIAAVALGPEAGYVALAMQVMQAPMALIGNAVAQVYLSRASDERRFGTLGAFTVAVVGGLLKSGVGPLVFAGIVAPSAFSVIFGPEWNRAGVLVSWMTPWFILQLLASPVSMGLHVVNSQVLALMIQLIGLVGRVTSVILAAYFYKDYIAETYAVSGAVFYLLYLIVVLKAVSARGGELFSSIKSSLPVVVAWTIMGVLVKIGILKIDILF